MLIDAGFSCKEIFRRLDQIGEDPAELDGIVVTHEHSDHVKGLSVLTKRLNIPIYLSHGTWSALEKKMHEVEQKYDSINTYMQNKIPQIDTHLFNQENELKKQRTIIDNLKNIAKSSETN